MNFVDIMNIYLEVILRAWKLSVGVLLTWIAAFFGSPVLLLIDPEITEILKLIIPLLVTIASGAATGLITFKRWKMETQKMQREHEKNMKQAQLEDRQFFMETMETLIEKGKIPPDATLQESVRITKEFLKSQTED